MKVKGRASGLRILLAMREIYGFDAFAPRQIAERVNELGVAKARLPLPSLVMLGMLAGAFIGLGSLFAVIVHSDASLGFAARRVLGGAVFSLGLRLVNFVRRTRNAVRLCEGPPCAKNRPRAKLRPKITTLRPQLSRE